MWTIKICGIRTERDYWLVRQAGADAVGLNFYSRSPRYAEPHGIKSWLPQSTDRCLHVGVFVNHRLDDVLRIGEQLALDAIQLHGDEPVEYVERLAPWAVIRAVRRQEGETVVEACQRVFQGQLPPHNVRAILIDTAAPDQYGGTGQVGRWERLDQLPAPWSQVACILAGGLRPENVYQAIFRTRPAGVDVASGVERKPGEKDAALVQQFVAAARSAWQHLATSDSTLAN